MNVQYLIASKQSELVRFVNTHAASVVVANVDDAERGRLAVDMLRLLAAATSAPAPAQPAVTIEPAPAPFQFVERETAMIEYRGQAYRWGPDLSPQAEVDAAPPAPSPVDAVEEQTAKPARRRVATGGKVRFTAEMIAAAVALGGSVRDIAKRLGGSEETVRKGMKAAGITLPRAVMQAARAAAAPVAGQQRWQKQFTDEAIAAAAAKGGSVEEIAERLGCCRATVSNYNVRVGRPRARPVVAGGIAPSHLPAVWVDANGGAWDDAARERLIELSKIEPRPSNEAIAFALGRTTTAVQTALSRLGITRAGKLAISRLKDRPCITCRRAFLSEGPGNRMCTRCRARGDDAVAA